MKINSSDQHKASSEKIDAFTLPEVMIALLVVATSMTLLTNLQVRSLLRVQQGREFVDRMFVIKQHIYELFMDPQKYTKPRVIRLEDPEVKIVTEIRSVAQKSTLASLGKNLTMLTSRGEWQSGPKKYDIPMISFYFKHEEKSP